MSRRDFLKISATASVGMALPRIAPAFPTQTDALGPGAGSLGPADWFLEPDSTFFATAFAEYAASYATTSSGDLWPSCWADDDNVYAANGDGPGFGSQATDVVVNRIIGTPDVGISGVSLAAGPQVANVYADPAQYNRKPTGMVAVDGNGDGRDELYLAVQDQRFSPAALAFDDAPNASISVSADYGQTWQTTSAPMFSNYTFTTIMFLDFGKSASQATVLGAEGATYVYAYGLDDNWRTSHANTVPSPISLYLARVPKTSIQDRTTWQFYTSTDASGTPQWSLDIAARAPVLTDPRRIYPTLFAGEGPTELTVISQGGVVYNAPLKRYLYTSWSSYTFEFYEAPAPWGPWRLFMTKDFGGRPWFGSPRGTGDGCPGPKNGGYACTIPSKFVSADGTDMWLQSNWFLGVACGVSSYNFSLRRLHLSPRHQRLPTNRPDPANNLARSGSGTTTIEKSARHGHGSYYNDGIGQQSEDSYDHSPKPLDFWGYTWNVAYHMDRVVYTTGQMFSDGGWFHRGLTVQVRQGMRWVGVRGLVTSPAYPYAAAAGTNRTYTLAFAATHGDGLRIIGVPGGTSSFTSIGELEVYFDG